METHTRAKIVAIRLSPSWRSWPIWLVRHDDCPENVDPRTIINNEDLLTKLMEWDDRFQTSYDMADPSAIPEKSFTERHEREGRKLATLLQIDTGLDVSVCL